MDDEWKLLVRYPGKDTTKYRNVHVWDQAPVRLFNLKNDLHEKHNLAGERPKVVERLNQAIENWHKTKVKPQRKQLLFGGKSFLLGGRQVFLTEPAKTSVTGTSTAGGELPTGQA